MRKGFFSVLAAAAMTLSCGGVRHRGERVIPSEIAIEFSSGAAPLDPALLPRLRAIAVTSLFVPAVRAEAAGGSARFTGVAPPVSPYPLPVYLEVEGAGDFDTDFQHHSPDTAGQIWNALAPALASRAYGTVAGVHLSLRVANAGAGYAAALAQLRRKLPPNLTLSVALFSKLSDEDQKGWKRVAEVVDFVIPEIFGRVADTDPAGWTCSAEPASPARWGLPLMAGIAPQGWGVQKSNEKIIADSELTGLSEDRRFDFSFGDIFSASSENTYIFTARKDAGNLPWGGRVAAGDSITFHEYGFSDFLKAFSLSRAARCRVVRLSALDDTSDLFGFSVLEDALLGRPLQPAISFTRSDTQRAVTFVAVNSTAEFSSLSRLGNWIDLRFEGGRIGSVANGDFDRYQFLDSAGRLEIPARADRIRFFENFVGPGRSLTAGPIFYSGDVRFFASAHIELPNGKIVTTPETEVAAASGSDP